MNSQHFKPRYLYLVLIPLAWVAYNGCLFLFSPGIHGVKSVDKIVDIENLLRSETDRAPFTIDYIGEFENSHNVHCHRTWSGVTELGSNANNNTSVTFAYVMSCDLPRFWISDGGVWNLIVPLRVSAGFLIDEENDEIILISIIIRDYFSGLFYN